MEDLPQELKLLYTNLYKAFRDGRFTSRIEIAIYQCVLQRKEMNNDLMCTNTDFVTDDVPFI